ncbi:MAG: hypothetical protein ACK52E_16420 [Aphanizomenon sp.]|jgi:hypothetical protein
MQINYNQCAEFNQKRDKLENGKFHPVPSSIIDSSHWQVSFKSQLGLVTIKANISKRQAEQLAIVFNELIE